MAQVGDFENFFVCLYRYNILEGFQQKAEGYIGTLRMRVPIWNDLKTMCAMVQIPQNFIGAKCVSQKFHGCHGTHAIPCSERAKF